MPSQTRRVNQGKTPKCIINKQWEVIALEQLTSHTERRPTTTETRVAYDNSTWHAINTLFVDCTEAP